MSASACVENLRDRNIGLQGEEFYAVMASYIKKISELQGEEKGDPKALLAFAGKSHFTGAIDDKKSLEKALNEFLKGKDKTLVAICTGKASSEEKISLLHDYAVTIGQARDTQMSMFKMRSKKISKVYDELESDKSKYADLCFQYNELSALRFNPDQLEDFISKTAGKVKTDMSVLRENVIANIVKTEENFFTYQLKFIGRTVDFLVEDSCQMLCCNLENGQESGEVC